MTAYLHLIDQRRLIGPGGSTVSGTIAFYYSGTSVLAPIYQDPNLAIPSTNPVSVAAGAVVPNIYLDSSISYKRRIEYSDGTVDEQDPLGFLFSGDDLGIPVGTIIDYPGPTIPNGYLLCAGQEVGRSTYPDLFAAIGTTYGSGNGTTTFNLPDIRGRVVAGKDNMNGIPVNRLTTQVTGSTLGAVGGTEEVTLTSTQIPSHTHTVNDPGHTHTLANPVIDTTGSLSAPPGGGLGIVTTATTSSSTTGITLSNTGGGGAHSNVQPTIIFNKVIKTMKTTALSLINLLPTYNTKSEAAAIGIAPSDLNMGTFSNPLLPDNGTVKSSLIALATAIESVSPDPMNVKHFGAVGDGITDDTLAVQAAVTAMCATANGSHLYFPEGTYKITDEIIFPFSTGWRIYGGSRGKTVIRQFADNKRIFYIAGDLSYGWTIEELTFDYANVQPVTNTNSISIHLSNSAGTLFGYFNFQIRRCTFNSGYRAICGSTINQTPVWGAKISECSFGGTLSGASIYFVPSPAVGQPNISVQDCYISTNGTEASLQIAYCDNLVLQNIEWNGGYSTGSQNIPLLQVSSSNVTVIGCRSEAYDFRTYVDGAVWGFSQSTFSLIGCAIASIKATGGSSNGNIAIRGNVGSRGNLIGTTIGAETTGFINAYSIDEVTFVDKITMTGNVTDNTLTFLGFRSNKKLDLSKRMGDFADFRNDVNVTMTNLSGRQQIYNSTLTDHRSIILPNTGMSDGMEIEIVRNGGGTPGAFTLTVIDPLSGQNHVFASNTNGNVRYRSNGGSYTKLSASTF